MDISTCLLEEEHQPKKSPQSSPRSFSEEVLDVMDGTTGSSSSKEVVTTETLVIDLPIQVVSAVVDVPEEDPAKEDDSLVITETEEEVEVPAESITTETEVIELPVEITTTEEDIIVTETEVIEFPITTTETEVIELPAEITIT